MSIKFERIDITGVSMTHKERMMATLGGEATDRIFYAPPNGSGVARRVGEGIRKIFDNIEKVGPDQILENGN